MDDLDDLRAEYLELRERCPGAALSTLGAEHIPAASYAPIAWLDGQAYLFLSELAAHTQTSNALRRSVCCWSMISITAVMPSCVGGLPCRGRHNR